MKAYDESRLCTGEGLAVDHELPAIPRVTNRRGDGLCRCERTGRVTGGQAWNTSGFCAGCCCRERVISTAQRLQLVGLKLSCQVRSLATHISERGHHGVRQLALHAEAPLLDIRPHDLGGNSCDVQRVGDSSQAAVGRGPSHASNAGVAIGVILRHVEHEGRAALQRSRIGFVAGAVEEENAIASAKGGFPVTLRVPGKSNPGRRIKPAHSTMDGHTTRWHSILAALYQSVINPGSRLLRSSGMGWWVLGSSSDPASTPAAVWGVTASAVVGLKAAGTKL